jgi:hypothetical protein
MIEPNPSAMNGRSLLMGSMQNNLAVSPYLTKAATARTGDDKIPGYYSNELDMWVVDTVEGPKPIIAEGALSELLTKTKVNAEQDDEAIWMLEMMTKTAQNVEQDDDRPWEQSHLLQLMTKTDTISERDDNCEINHLLELMTKTEAQQERDDNGNPAFGF